MGASSEEKLIPFQKKAKEEEEEKEEERGGDEASGGRSPMGRAESFRFFPRLGKGRSHGF